MENMKNLCTRNFFLPLLALIMCVGLVCTPAFAADAPDLDAPAEEVTETTQDTNDSDESYVDGEDPAEEPSEDEDPAEEPEHTHSYVDGVCECGAAEPEDSEEPTEGEDPADTEEPEPAVCTCTEKCGEGGNDECDVCRADAGACKPTSSGVKWDAETGTLTVTGTSDQTLNGANLTVNGESITNLKPTHVVIDGFGTVANSGDDFKNALTNPWCGSQLEILEINNVGLVGNQAFSGLYNEGLTITVSNSKLDNWAFNFSAVSEIVLDNVDATYGSLANLAPYDSDPKVKVSVRGGHLSGNALMNSKLSELELEGVGIDANAFNGASADYVTVNGGKLVTDAFLGFAVSELELNQVTIEDYNWPFNTNSSNKVTVNGGSFGPYAFWGYTMSELELNDVTIADGKAPFQNANSNKVTVNGGSLGNNAFNGINVSEVVLDNVTIENGRYPFSGVTMDKVTVKNGSLCDWAFYQSTIKSQLELDNVTIKDNDHPFCYIGVDDLKVTVNGGSLGNGALGGCNMSEVELNNTTVGNDVFAWVTNDLSVTVNNSNLSDGALNGVNVNLLKVDGVIVKATSDSLQDLIDKSEGTTKLVISGVIHSTSDSESIFIRNGKDIILVAGENGATIKAADRFNKSLFVIEKGGKLTIDDANLTIEGAAEGKTVDSTSASALVFQVNGELVLNNGTIKGGGSGGDNSKGAIVLNNGAKFTMTGGTITDTRLYDWYSAPVVVSSGAEFLMSGGKITNNRNVCGAGAVVVYTWNTNEARAKMTLTGDAEISDNRTYKDAGGIALWGDVELYMDGGVIKNNSTESGFGGGISVAGRTGGMKGIYLNTYIPKCVFTMDGGEISNNYAGESGGGIYVNSNDVTLNAGLIKDNRARWNGGGIYVETPVEGSDPNPKSAHLSNAVIYHNTATVMGGGMYFCPTGTSEQYVNEGPAIFGNQAINKDGETAGCAGDDFASVSSYFYDKSATITERMLGGGKVDWYLDGKVYEASSVGHDQVDRNVARYDAENAELVEAGTYNYSIALKAVVSDEAKELAMANGKLFITGNTAAYGGGVGSNGNVTVGNPDTPVYELNVDKVWSGVPQGEQKPVIIQLVIDGVKLDTIELSAENDWSAAFKGLPEIVKDKLSVVELTEGYSVSYSKVTVSEDGTTTLSITVTNAPVPTPTPDPDPTPDPEPDPDPDPEVEIPEVDVPLAEPDIEPEPEVEIPDVDVPLSDVPQTGDNSAVWYVLAALSVSGLAVLALVEKRKEQEG